jgi:hypothetical protein
VSPINLSSGKLPFSDFALKRTENQKDELISGHFADIVNNRSEILEFTAEELRTEFDFGSDRNLAERGFPIGRFVKRSIT